MKTKFCIVIIALVSACAQAQSRRPRTSLPSPCATNEFGRTHAEQQKYDNFLKSNPSGKNRFGRTFDEDTKFIETIAVTSFLGFSFGTEINGERTQILEKPFRMFNEVSLVGSALNRVIGVDMTQKTKDLSLTSISNETANLILLLENEYKVAFRVKSWNAHWMSEGYSAEFKNTNVEMRVSCSYVKRNGEGELSLTVRNIAMSKFDQQEKERREFKAVEERQKSVVLSQNEGADMISASKPNAKPKTRGTTPSNSLLDRRLRRGDAAADLLEPMLPIEDAVKLTRANEPRGYYQLAINISKNRSWTDKTFDAQKHIDYCLKTAADAGYLNAVFLQTLIRDNKLGTPHYGMLGRSNENSPTQLMRKYCGFELSSWRIDGSLTNDSEVAELIGVYKNLESKGLKQATEAMAGLQKRVKDVKVDLEKRKERDIEHDKVADLVRSVVKLPEEKKETSSTSSIRDSAQKAGRIYIKTTEDETAKTSWSHQDRKPVTIEFYDANEGLTREFRFSADGRLLLVSPVQ